MTRVHLGAATMAVLVAAPAFAAGTRTTYVVQRGDYDRGAASDDVVMSDEVVGMAMTDGPGGRPVAEGVIRFGARRLWNAMARRILSVQPSDDRVDVTVQEEGGRFRETYSLGGVLVERLRIP